MLVPPAGAPPQGTQLFDPEQPVWTVLPAQTPPQRCSPAGHPMPVPVDALVDAALVLVALLVAVVVVVEVALVVDGSPPAPVVVGPSATLPPAPLPPKPPSPSLLALEESVALAQPCAAPTTASATNNEPKPIVFTPASTPGLSPISETIAIVQRQAREKVRAPL